MEPKLLQKLKKYPKLSQDLSLFYSLLKGKISFEEFFDKLLEPYFGFNLEVYEKLAEILKSQEIWDGKSEYETSIELEDGESVKVRVSRSFVILEKNDVVLKYKVEFGEKR